MESISRIVFLNLITLCTIANIHAQDLGSDLDSLISGYPSNALDTNQNPDFIEFNGVVLVAKKNDIVFKKAYGKANLQWNVDNTIHTKFLIGSVSKTFTSMLTLQLVQDGRLKLRDKLVDFIYSPSETLPETVLFAELLSRIPSMFP